MDPHRFSKNPFYVLELRPGCKRVDIERQGQKLLSMLEVGADIGDYATPVGRFPRSADDVRQAIEHLRDPEVRATLEFWAVLPSEPLPIPPRGRTAGWPDAVDSFGF